MEDIGGPLPDESMETPVVPKRVRRKKAESSVDPIVSESTESTEVVLPEVVPEATPVPRKKKYINNGDLMIQIAISRQQNKMTDELAKMLFMLVQRYAKHPDYANIHSYKMDMEAFALLTIVKVWKGFNPEKGNNPFAYFTQVIRHAFYQYLNHEKKQRDTKDLIRIDMGQDPSFAFMENYREDRGDNDFENSFDDGDNSEPESGSMGYDKNPGEASEINYIVERGDDGPPIETEDGQIDEI